MPYPSGHRERVRNRIVETARRLFNRHGFDGVSVDRIMADAGLTRGGFYSYFKSKSELYAKVLDCFFTDPSWKYRWEGIDIDLTSTSVAPQIVSAYLSRQHFEDVEHSCPMVALPSDVARSDEKVKEAFGTVFKAMVTFLCREVRTTARNREGVAMAIAAVCVGGMVVARSLNDDSFADRLRDAARDAAMVLGGWKSGVSSRNRGPSVKNLSPRQRKAAGRVSGREIV